VLLQQVIGGLATGTIYGLIALGFVLVYKATGIVNFAVGEMVMIPAFVALSLIGTLGLAPAGGFLLTIGAGALLGVAIDLLIVRPLTSKPHVSVVMATIALGMILRSGAGLLWGFDTYRLPTTLSLDPLRVGGVAVSRFSLWIFAVTGVLVLLLYGFFARTRMGTGMRAAAQNPVGATLVGISPRRVGTATWAVSGAVGAIAALLIAPLVYVNTHMADLSIKAFAAAVLGGFGSVPGALAGGIVLGVLENLAGLYLPKEIKFSFAFVVLIAVLIVRPSGLFGTASRKKV
jgi:branched-chain amino acid transport system permease protein